jgi:2,3-bisphosphoglycerate-dependent phosphoglycerate mutase
LTEHRQLRYVAPPDAATLLLARHGESAPVRDGEPVPLLGGSSNPALDPVGVEQAERLAERLAGDPISAIYVTPLRRTAETAAPLAQRLGLEPRVEEDLREVNLGEWEGGLFRKHVRELHPIAVRVHDEQRWDVIPGAEPGERFAARVRAGLERIAAAHAGETVLVVSHGGTIGQALTLALGIADRPLELAAADNGSLSEIVVGPDGWTVRRFNDTAHL